MVNKKSLVNFFFSLALVSVAFVFFSLEENKVPPTLLEDSTRTNKTQSRVKPAEVLNTNPEESPTLLEIYKASGLPINEDAKREFPADLKAQLKASPPPLPENMKQQVNREQKFIPYELVEELSKPQPKDIPEDIKRALNQPPQTFSAEEINNQ